MYSNVKLRKLLSAHKSHVRETSLFTGASWSWFDASMFGNGTLFHTRQLVLGLVGNSFSNEKDIVCIWYELLNSYSTLRTWYKLTAHSTMSTKYYDNVNWTLWQCQLHTMAVSIEYYLIVKSVFGHSLCKKTLFYAMVAITCIDS